MFQTLQLTSQTLQSVFQTLQLKFDAKIQKYGRNTKHFWMISPAYLLLSFISVFQRIGDGGYDAQFFDVRGVLIAIFDFKLSLVAGTGAWVFLYTSLIS